jgi:chromosome segregation ATPase
MAKSTVKKPVKGKISQFFTKHRDTIILVISILMTIYLCQIFFGNGQKHLKDQIGEEKAKVELLQRQRDSLSAERAVLESKQDSLENKIETQKGELTKIDSKLHKSEKDLKEAKTLVGHYRSEMDSVQAKINNLKEHPIKRSGDELLNSLGKKLNN